MQLRRLISEMVIREQTEPSQKHTPAGSLNLTGKSASDNKSAMIVKKDSSLSTLLDTLNTRYSGEYYIWSKSKNLFPGIHQSGAYFKKGSGDPYTYQLLGKGQTKDGREGNRYRVISGPKHSSAGAKPIGATFVMAGELAPVPVPPQASGTGFSKYIFLRNLERERDGYKGGPGNAKKIDVKGPQFVKSAKVTKGEGQLSKFNVGLNLRLQPVVGREEFTVMLEIRPDGDPAELTAKSNEGKYESAKKIKIKRKTAYVGDAPYSGPGGFKNLPEEFTLDDLRTTYRDKPVLTRGGRSANGVALYYAIANAYAGTVGDNAFEPVVQAAEASSSSGASSSQSSEPQT